MATKKYARDYTTERRLDEKGRRRLHATYHGDWFTFQRPRAQVRRSAWLLLALSVLAAVTVLLPLLMKNDYAEQFYVLPVLVFAAVPLYLLFAALWRVRQAGDAVTREHKDRISQRIPKAAVMLLAAGVLGVAGSVAYRILAQPSAADWVCMGLSVARLALAVAIFLLRGAFAMQAASPKLPDSPPQGGRLPSGDAPEEAD